MLRQEGGVSSAFAQGGGLAYLLITSCHAD